MRNLLVRRLSLKKRSEVLFKCSFQSDIGIRQAHWQAEINKTGHAKLRIGDAAGRNATKMGQIRVHIETQAVKTDPFFQSDAKR